MPTQIFHFSNTGISSGQRFYLKDEVSGIFLNNLNINSNFPIVASNLVYNTGNQNIGGNKTFTGITTFSGQEVNLVDTALNLSGIGDMTFSSTNINFINSPVFISGTNLRVSGDIYGYNIFVSGNPVLTGVDLTSTVRTTGNQIVSGVKDFQSPPLFSGREIYYQKNTIYFTGNSFTPDYLSGRNFVYQLTGFATVYNNLNDPVNMPEGETIIIKVVQSNFSNNYMIFGNNYRFPADASPLLTQASGKTDLFNIFRLDNRFYTTYIKNFSN